MVYDPRIRAGIFAGESGGDYNALFGYQNRPNGRFSNVNLTSMPISDVLAFTDPSGPYAQYVKGEVGRVATPVGAYQVVGSTLRDAVNALGIDPSTPFNQETQDRIGQWILENQGTGAWGGYRHGSQPSTQSSTFRSNKMPISPQQPQGILGSLGIQKQDPNAAGETALPFYQRDRFKDTMGSLAMAFNELRMNPSQTIPQVVQSNRERRQTAMSNNRTIEWLRTQPNGEQYAQMIQAGGSPAAVLQAYQQAQAAQAAAARGEVREVDGRIVRVMPDGTVQEIYSPYANGGASPEQISQAGALRDDLNKELGDFGIVRSGYDNIMTFYNSPNGVTDYALAVAFAKILDPGSVAHEGEVAAVRNAGAQVPAFAQFFENALTGKGSFTPEVRQQIAKAASDIYSQKASNAQTVIDKYRAASEQFGIPWDLVYMGGDIPSAQPVAPVRPTVPASAAAAGVTQQQWDEMTTAEKAVFP